MLLPFSTRFNPLLLPSRFPSMTLTSSPSPNIAGIVRVDIPDIVFHIVTKPPSALSAPAPADAASFLKGAASPPSCRCSWQHTGGKRQHTGKKKGQKNFSSGFAAFQSLYSRLGAPSDILNSGSGTPACPSHQDCQQHPPTQK